MYTICTQITVKAEENIRSAGLNLQMVITCNVCARTWFWVSAKASSVLTGDSPLQAWNLFISFNIFLNMLLRDWFKTQAINNECCCCKRTWLLILVHVLVKSQPPVTLGPEWLKTSGICGYQHSHKHAYTTHTHTTHTELKI